MPGTTQTSTNDRWSNLLTSPEGLAAFASKKEGLTRLWGSLSDFAANIDDADERRLVEALSKIASLFVRPNDWNSPYGPAMSFEDRRSPIPTDLVAEDLELLEQAVAQIPNPLLRARTYDVLFLFSQGEKRAQHLRGHLDALLAAGVKSTLLIHERETLDRALIVARRFGSSGASRLRAIEQRLIHIIRRTNKGFVALRAADILAEHRLGREKAPEIAGRLFSLAMSEERDAESRRSHLKGAADWYQRSGNSETAYAAAKIEVLSYIDEATALTDKASAGDSMRASYLLERALKRVRSIPRSARGNLGLLDTPATIANRIRELGAEALGQMSRFSSDPVDLSSAIAQARKQVTGRPRDEALLAFSALSDFSNFDEQKEAAIALIREHPLQSLFSHTSYSRDGRVVHRSEGQGGTPIHGVDPSVWRQMLQSYSMRIGLLVQGALWPAYEQIANEHNVTVTDIVPIVERSAIIPADRTLQYATALYYGFNGDFSTSAQLLTPQIENLVRHHMTNAGMTTSTISADQTESEMGLSALMERELASDIFGADITFEFRALLTSPLGPNLRNEVAHGLLGDREANSANSLYLWWIALRLVFIPYWNSLHDADRAEARVPAEPRYEPPNET